MAGDVVSPGFYEDYLTTEGFVAEPNDSADGYMFDFAINLQTLHYLQGTNALKRDEEAKALAFMKSGLPHVEYKSVNKLCTTPHMATRDDVTCICTVMVRIRIAVIARQFSYMQDDGSFKMFRRAAKPCLW